MPMRELVTRKNWWVHETAWFLVVLWLKGGSMFPQCRPWSGKGFRKKVQEIDLFGQMRTMLRHFVEKLRVTMVTFGRWARKKSARRDCSTVARDRFAEKMLKNWNPQKLVRNGVDLLLRPCHFRVFLKWGGTLKSSRIKALTYRNLWFWGNLPF